MEPIDEDAVSDAERTAKGVPTLDKAHARLARQNAERQAAMDADGDSASPNASQQEDAGDER
ncbi:MAG: hypothetical protein AAF809_09155 [Bacteroidota bacterium]